ncbi:hypothetical protein [Eikenella corrodens]|uniref:hypothetical protein n=1 Tax=Eikenella corrodens TaxID=539 RepID=UPI0012DA7AC8|nr:hypothetical protein [Eikenella corrodens]
MQKGALSLPKFIPQIKRILFSGSLIQYNKLYIKINFQFLITNPILHILPGKAIPAAFRTPNRKHFLTNKPTKIPCRESMGKELERVTGIEPA